MEPLVVGVGGSLREGSSSLVAAQVVLAAAEEAGARTRLLDLAELDLPFYRPGPPPHHEGVSRLVDAVGAADGLVWSAPMYHGTVSGSFKNALDWLELLSDAEPKYLTGKVVALVSAAGGGQALQAVNNLEYVVRSLRGWTLPLVAPLNRAWRTVGDGTSVDPAVARQLHAVGTELVAALRSTAAGRVPAKAGS